MRRHFENGTITEMTYKGYLVTMNSIRCFVVRQESTGFQVVETSSKEDIQWVRNYIDNLTF